MPGDQGEDDDCDDDTQGDDDGQGDDDCDHDDDEGEPCEVIAMDPSPDSHVATPLSTVTITFNHAIDQSSATDDTVQLRERESRRRVRVGIAPGASEAQLRLTPILPLMGDKRFTVEVQGVVDADGQTCVYSARFFKRVHLREAFERYNTGGLATYYDSVWDPVARIRTVPWMGAGPDHLAGTDDDFQRDLTQYHYDALQDSSYMLNRMQPGGDGVYYTDDDVIRVERYYAYTGIGLDWIYETFPGLDGDLGTADDRDDNITTRHYDPTSDRETGVCFVDAGADVTAFTGDDSITSCKRYVSLDDEFRTLTSVAPGVDGDWLTDDDEPGPTWTRAILDDVRAVTRREIHALAGDGTATPTDATLQEYTVIDRDANHLPTESRTYTSDGVGTDRVVDTYDADGFVLTETTYRAGDDGDHGTGDDFLFQRFFYDWP